MNGAADELEYAIAYEQDARRHLQIAIEQLRQDNRNATASALACLGQTIDTNILHLQAFNELTHPNRETP